MATRGPDGIHPTARGFDTAAADYERARPDYPDAALRAAAERLGLGPRSVVVDLAAGTGKLTRSLTGLLGLRTIAVEPSSGMRATFLAAVPGVPVLAGTAEQIPLGDGAVDAVFVGQAFHWFDAATALREIARVLRPRGGLALCWNTRDESVPWVARFGEIVRSVAQPDDPSARSDAWRAVFDGPTPFEPLERAAFASASDLPADALVSRALSVSYVARLPPEGRAEIARRIGDLVAADPALRDRSRIAFPYVTEIFTTRRRD